MHVHEVPDGCVRLWLVGNVPPVGLGLIAFVGFANQSAASRSGLPAAPQLHAVAALQHWSNGRLLFALLRVDHG